MRISRSLLNHTLTLQTITRTDDGAGGYTEGWTDSTSFRARICPVSAREQLLQDKVTPQATHHVYCDYMTITEDNRIKWGSKYLEILGIRNPSQASGHLEIDVREAI